MKKLMCVLFCVGCGSAAEPAASPIDAAAADVAIDAAEASVDAAADGAQPHAGPFTLTSASFVDGGTLPAEFTCDGVGHSPPLAWMGIPSGTKSLALLMTTEAKDGLKWNWVLYGVPPTASSLAVASKGVGTCGLTSDGPALAYAPPCSAGPGAKLYTFTLYALSADPVLPAVPKDVTGAVLTSAIAPITLAKSAVTVSYTR
jgi:phosphatidylethanolamine-binding protein (PEBP) family uncharacterized protein